MIVKKVAKEANRFIKQWPAEKISIENGRWGPFIRFQKKMLKLPRKTGGDKYAPEELENIDVAVIKSMIEDQVPGAFSKKTKAAAKKTGSPAVKKAAKKKATKK